MTREQKAETSHEAAPTCANASDFISRCMEDHLDQLTGRERYVDYIAQRPHAERMGAHALFTDRDRPLVLEQVVQEVSNHPGNVWLPIISLSREDAVRLGYDNAQRWRDLLSARAPDIARAMKIPWEHFRWYAAFHDEGHHPHVHMICYSADGKSGFLNKDGIAAIKSGLVKEIFAGELTELYQQQTARRDALTAQARSSMEQVIQEMQTGTLDNPRIEQLITDLSRQLRTVTGKKQYGYLEPQLKAVVDEIVDELAKDPRIALAYESWYLLREEVLRSYKDDLPDRLPLSRQKEFKQIRNMVIQEAERIEPPSVEEMILLYERGRAGDENAKRQFEAKRESAKTSALQGATRLLHHMSRIFREQMPRPPMQMTVVDSKLRRRIKEKKIAMGHKPDDHEQRM